MIDKEKYLKDLQGEVRAAEERHGQGLAAFREATTGEALEAALEKIVALTQAEDVQKAVGVFANKAETSGLRLLALVRSINGLSDRPDLIQVCLSVLADRTEPAGLRTGVFNTLSALSFSSRALVALRSDYLALLRTLLDDPEGSVRALAASELAKRKDEYVQRRLLEGLEGRSAPIVNEAKAIQLLGYDIHAEHFPVVRRLLAAAGTDDATKLEAIHVLANDPAARPLLTSLWQDKGQDKEIRMSSAMALQTGDPAAFVPIAKSMILDETEHPEVRAVCLNAMTILHRVGEAALREDTEFSTSIARLHQATGLPELKKLSQRFLDNASRPPAR